MSVLTGQRLRAVRLREGLNQTELANRAGISQALLSSMERGDRVGSLATLNALSRELNVSITWLTGSGEDPLSSETPSSTDDDGRRAVIADEQSPPGLRLLATDDRLLESLQVTPAEWEALRTLKAPGLISREGYLAVLFAIRSGLR